MHFKSCTLFTALLVTAAQASPDAVCNTKKFTVVNGGFEGSPSLAPWTLSGASGYTAEKVTQPSSSTDIYVAKFSPPIPSNPMVASSDIDLFQNFTVCANHNYSISWTWAVNNNASGGLRLFGKADPQNLCPDNCVFSEIFDQRTTAPDFYSSSVTLQVPAVTNSTKSVIALMFEFYTFSPYDKRQVFTLDNVTVTPI